MGDSSELMNLLILMEIKISQFCLVGVFVGMSAIKHKLRFILSTVQCRFTIL